MRGVGTIFEANSKKQTTTRHRVPQDEVVTNCGVDLSTKLPSRWSQGATWNLDPHQGKREVRCKRCYPKFKEARDAKIRKKRTGP